MPQSQRGGNLSLILIFWNGLEPPNACTVTMGYAPRWLFQRGNDDQQWYGLGYPIFRHPFWLKQSFGNLQSFNTWMWIVRSWNPTIYPRCFLDWRRGVCFCRLTFRFVWWVGYGQFQYTFLLVESCSFQSLCLVNFPFWWWIRQNAAILEHLSRESRHLLLQLGSPSPKLVRSHYIKILTWAIEDTLVAWLIKGFILPNLEIMISP